MSPGLDLVQDIVRATEDLSRQLKVSRRKVDSVKDTMIARRCISSLSWASHAEQIFDKKVAKVCA